MYIIGFKFNQSSNQSGQSVVIKQRTFGRCVSLNERHAIHGKVKKIKEKDKYHRLHLEKSRFWRVLPSAAVFHSLPKSVLMEVPLAGNSSDRIVAFVFRRLVDAAGYVPSASVDWDCIPSALSRSLLISRSRFRQEEICSPSWLLQTREKTEALRARMRTKAARFLPETTFGVPAQEISGMPGLLITLTW